MASLNCYKEQVMNMCAYKGWNKVPLEKVWLLLTEEVGELAGSIRRHSNTFKDNKKVCIEDELGDVFSYLFQIAGMLQIDLDHMWYTNQSKSYYKKYIKTTHKEHNHNKYKNKNVRRSSEYTKSTSNRAENIGMVSIET